LANSAAPLAMALPTFLDPSQADLAVYFNQSNSSLISSSSLINENDSKNKSLVHLIESKTLSSIILALFL
jgi:hypothetical protein